MDIEELKIVLEAEISQAVKNLKNAQKVLNDFTKDLKKSEAESKSFFNRWSMQFALITGASMGAMYMMIRASPTLAVGMAQIQFQFERLAYVLGEELAPAMEVIVPLITQLVDWFIALPKPVKQFIAVIIVLIALLGPIIGLITTLGPLLGAIGIGGTAAAGGITVLGVSLGTLIPVIGLVIVAIALLYVAWVNNWGGIQDITYGAIDAISEGINTFVEIMTETWETGLALIKAIWAGDWQEVENILLDIFGRLPGPLADFAELGLGIIKDMMGAIVAIFSGDWDKAAEYMAKAMEKIQELILNLGKWMYEAGKNLINSLVQGIQDAVAAAGDALSEAAEGVSDYFGGSLPEKGPLKNIYRYGQELAEFYAAGISKGLSRVESQLSVNISIPTAVGTTYNVYKLEPKIEMVNNTAVTPYDLKSMLTQIFEELLSDYHRRAY